MDEKNTVPRTRSAVKSTMPTARGGKAKSISAFVKSIDHAKGRMFVQETPLLRVLKIVVMKFIEDIVTEAARMPRARAATVTPGWGLNWLVLRGA